MRFSGFLQLAVTVRHVLHCQPLPKKRSVARFPVDVEGFATAFLVLKEIEDVLRSRAVPRFHVVFAEAIMLAVGVDGGGGCCWRYCRVVITTVLTEREL